MLKKEQAETTLSQEKDEQPCLPHFTVASEPPPNLESTEKIRKVRLCIQAIIDDEDLLSKCVSFPNKFFLATKHIPTLVNETVKKAGLNLTTQEVDECIKVFNSTSSMIKPLYIKYAPYNGDNVYQTLCEFSERYFEKKYVNTLVIQAKKIIKEAIPEIYRDVPYETYLRSKSSEENASREKVSTTHHIVLETTEDLTLERDYGTLKTSGAFSNGQKKEKPYEFSRKIYDLIAIVHEYAHAIFDEINNCDRKAPDSTEIPYYLSVDAAFNEGFAILVETLVCNFLIQQSDSYSLTQKDIDDLRQFKSQRFQSLLTIQFETKRDSEKLLQNRSAYSEGFIRIISKLYRTQGITAVIDLVTNIDREKTLTTRRDSEPYIDLIALAEDPTVFLEKIQTFLKK